jgi:UDP-GlcNAc:undecaprenyl-phosphate GlcNAc-1-phosphate transferase
MDMLAIVVRRYKNGKSPFKPDRDHLHHMLQRAGLSSRQTLAVISIAAALMSAVGISGEYFEVAEYIMLASFLVVFALYVSMIRTISKRT